MAIKYVSGGTESGIFARLFHLFSEILKQPRRRLYWIALVLVVLSPVAVSLSGCSGGGGVSGTNLSPRVIPPGQPIPKGGGRYKIGSPYKIDGQWYQPHEDRRYDRTGTASWYGEMFHARRTANGEIYDMDALTAAHPTLPLPVYAKVTNLRNGRTLIVRINDRGPYRHRRIIDLSRRSATLLGFKKAGTAPVRVQFLGRAPINGDDRYERNFLAQQRWANRSYALRKTDSLTVGSLPRSQLTSAKVYEPAYAYERASSPIRRNIFIQAGSFRNAGNANRFKRSLARFGPVNIETLHANSGSLYRVSLGPYYEDDEADRVLTNVVRAGVRDARIIRK